jgi:septal ring factor EnvC (AmiA/AmiB activator)
VNQAYAGTDPTTTLGGLHIERVRNMSGMTAYLGIILGAAGIVFGVIALMVSTEMSRRVTALIDARFEQSELELLKSLDKQDQELKRQRRVLGDALSEMEERFKATSAGADDLRQRLNAFSDTLDDVRNVRRVIPTDEERGFTAKAKPKESFVSASPFAD